MQGHQRTIMATLTVDLYRGGSKFTAAVRSGARNKLLLEDYQYCFFSRTCRKALVKIPRVVHTPPLHTHLLNHQINALQCQPLFRVGSVEHGTNAGRSAEGSFKP